MPGAGAFDRCVVDPVAHAGPLIAVRALLAAMPDGDAAVIVPADMPLVEPAHLREMIVALRRRPGAAVVMGRRCDERGRERVEPFPSAWRVSAARRLLSRAMNAGVRGPSRLAGWAGVITETVRGGPGASAWFDVDTRADAAQLSRWLGRTVTIE
jgi:CTP:molybdopterin cytidylyltransferase MocA